LRASAVKDPRPTQHFGTATRNSLPFEIPSETRQQLLAIADPILAVLLELDHMRTNEPVAQREIPLTAPAALASVRARTSAIEEMSSS
jgi:hypothetical protein